MKLQLERGRCEGCGLEKNIDCSKLCVECWRYFNGKK